MKTEDINESLSVKDIFNQNPKAKERFIINGMNGYISHQSNPQLRYDEFARLPLESQIGYILAWFRSEGYRHFSFQNFPHKGFSKFGMYKINKYTPDSIEQTGKDFNTAFLALLFELCKQVT